MLTGVSHSVRQARRKLPWGARQVGAFRTATGMARLAAMALRRPAQAVVTTRRDNLAISFRYPSQLIPTLVMFGELLEPELRLIPTALGPGRIAVDVGASIGTWTMSAARTGATVHACEPDPENLDMLAVNLQANGLADRVTTHCMAMAAHDGRGALISASRRYLNRVAAAENDAPSGCTLRTLTHFLDDLGIEEVDMVKVNTAGSEYDVLTGARGLFDHRRIKLALFLDGLAVRPLIDEICGDAYEMGVYNSSENRVRVVSRSAELDAAKSTPMDHYVVVRRKDQS